MESVKPIVYVLLLLCSAIVVCSERDPLSPEKWRTARRTVEPRLSNAKWRSCCRAPKKQTHSCKQEPQNARDALELLETAHGAECLDAAVAAIGKHARADLSAAYFVRAQRLDRPVDYLRALAAAEETLRGDPASPQARFNRALVLEKLGLTNDAIRAWDEVWKRERSQWSKEARDQRDALLARPDAGKRKPEAELRKASSRGDRAALVRLARAFPGEAVREFVHAHVLGLEAAHAYAEAMLAAGEPFGRDVMAASERPRDPKALHEGTAAFASALADPGNPRAMPMLERAAARLERAGNPLYLAARIRLASRKFSSNEDALPLLDPIAPIASGHNYRGLTATIHILRANALEQKNRYVEALPEYVLALQYARPDATATTDILVRRSANYATIGSAELAFRDSLEAIERLPKVAHVNARHQAYYSAAKAARKLGHPQAALQFQNAAIDVIQPIASVDMAAYKHHLAVALRERADVHIELGRDREAEADLTQAAALAESLDDERLRAPLKMRLAEVEGQAALNENPRRAADKFTEAISLAAAHDSTYRAVLLFKRAAARRKAHDPHADADTAAALEILRGEAANLLDSGHRGAYENLWSPYFSRFQAMYGEMVENALAGGDVAGAFLYAEQARAFEPLQLVLQSHKVPPGFRKLETREDLQRELGRLPADTVLLQYLVRDDQTYTWVLSRGSIKVVPQRATRNQIDRWVAEVYDAKRHAQNDRFRRVMRAVYDELFRTPLATVGGPGTQRFVVVPDGPMHGLPFAALLGKKEEGYLVERGSVAVAASTSLYLYALARDREFGPDRKPTVLIVGEPRIDPSYPLPPLHSARREAEELGGLYGVKQPMLGEQATIANFLDSVKTATIIHFAGHGVANAQSPWHSSLLLTPQGDDLGRLTAEKLMRELSKLERTRLVVLGACSTAGGQPIGPEGVAPLVRPLIAANVPAVVGTLWDVNDATAKDLLVSFHRHYRHGDDVTAALRYAQLEMLRNQPAMTWAPFQVIGHAASPYPRPARTEEIDNDHLRIENSVHRPHGLRPQ